MSGEGEFKRVQVVFICPECEGEAYISDREECDRCHGLGYWSQHWENINHVLETLRDYDGKRVRITIEEVE
jgi:DnaJ-class molecular chaperone